MSRTTAIVCAVAAVIATRCPARQGAVDVTVDVARDLARDDRGLLWHMDDHVLVQHAALDVETTARTVEIIAPSWRIAIPLASIHEVVCTRRFIHHPEPFVLLFVEFRTEPEDEGGFADSFVAVQFGDDREPAFTDLCDRHGLRKVGDL